MSLAYIPVLFAALSSARPEESGLASGLVNTTYQVGSAIGLAAMTALAIGVTGTTSTVNSLTGGYQAAFIGAAVIAAAAAAVAGLAIQRPRETASEEPVAAPLEQAA
jgi:MFS family permease